MVSHMSNCLGEGLDADKFLRNFSGSLDGMDPEYVVGRVSRRIWAIAIETLRSRRRARSLYHIQSVGDFALPGVHLE